MAVRSVDPELDGLLATIATLDAEFAAAINADLAKGDVDYPQLKRLLRQEIWLRRNRDSHDAPTIPRYGKSNAP